MAEQQRLDWRSSARSSLDGRRKEARVASTMAGMAAGLFVVGVTLGAPPGAAAGGSVAGSAVGWRSPATRCEVMAGNLRITPAFLGVVVDLCRRSPTFRRQVARLSDADGLTVTVKRAAAPSTALWRAQTVITRVGGQVQVAEVQIPPGDGRLVAELIAHEFEHILEQLDGVDLKRWLGRCGVHRVGANREDSPIETERAHQVGRLVAGEYASAAVEMTALKVR
jgi:hypothetical protein